MMDWVAVMSGKRKGWKYELLAALMRSPKYARKETQPAELGQELSASDRSALARLVRKYGRDAVVAAAQKVPLRGPGRPSRGLLPYYERLHLTDWIETVADEHRRAGSKQPYKDAELDMYELQYAGQEELRDVHKFRKTVKKARQQGRRDWQELARKVQEDPKLARIQGLPDWLVRRK